MRKLVFILMLIPLPLVAATTIEVRMSRDHCRWLVEHIPADDVAYKPGVDVRGKPVKPADLNSSATMAIPRNVDIDLTLPHLLSDKLVRLYGRLKAEARVGYVTVDTKTGDATYNGKTLRDPETAELITFCRDLSAK